MVFDRYKVRVGKEIRLNPTNRIYQGRSRSRTNELTHSKESKFIPRVRKELNSKSPLKKSKVAELVLATHQINNYKNETFSSSHLASHQR